MASGIGLQAQSTPSQTALAFLDASNSGDAAKVAALVSPTDLYIVDDFAPYSWSGSSALADWGRDLGKDAAARGLSQPSIHSQQLVRNEVSENHAYFIYSAVYSFLLKGVAMREPGELTMTMRKEEAGWKITSFSWSGSAPTAESK